MPRATPDKHTIQIDHSRGSLEATKYDAKPSTMAKGTEALAEPISRAVATVARARSERGQRRRSTTTAQATIARRNRSPAAPRSAKRARLNTRLTETKPTAISKAKPTSCAPRRRSTGASAAFRLHLHATLK